MPLLLCHECYFWVSPRDGRCPECDHVVDSGVPDPPTESLNRLIGPAVQPIGNVRFRRAMLPDRGMLFETTNGLYFVPHVVTRRMKLVERRESGRSFLWLLASLVFTPLILVLPFLKFKKLTAEEVPTFEPCELSAEQRNRLGELLMQNPGAFFIPRNAIRGFTRRWRRSIYGRRQRVGD